MRFAPTPTQLKSTLDPFYMAHKSDPKIHRCPSLLKTSRAANMMQLEQKQINTHSPVTMPFLTDIENPPNQLKHKKIIKSLDTHKNRNVVTAMNSTEYLKAMIRQKEGTQFISHPKIRFPKANRSLAQD